MTIRGATADDAAAVARVSVEAWRWAFGPFLPESILAPRLDLERRTERLRETWGKGGPTWVAVDGGGGVAGFATEYAPSQIAGVDAEIGALYVLPKTSRRGVGRALVRELVRRFVARGDRTMGVHTLAQNEIGCRFYEGLGGRRQAAEEWNGLPSVRFVWDDLPGLAARAGGLEMGA